MCIRVGYKMTEIGEIPEDCARARNKIKPRQYTSQPTKVSSKGDLIFCIRATIGNIAIADQQYCLGRGVAALRTKDLVNKDFLIQVLQTQFEFLASISAGSVIRGIKKDDLERLAIPMPPLPEQHKIASILSTVDDSIQKTDAVIKKTAMLKRGLMQKLLTRGIEHTQFKQTELGEIPEEWEMVPLNEVVNDIRYGTSVKSNNDMKGLPVLRIPNIIGGKVALDDLKWVELSKSEIHALLLEEGDLLIVRTNANPDYIGRSAQFKNHEGNWVFASYLIRIRPKRHKVDSDFLNLFLDSDAIRRRFRRIARTSAGNYNINTRNLRAVKIALPCLSEQKTISKILSQVENKIEVETRKLKNLQGLEAGLMQVLLTGKVRVKVD